MKQFFKILMLFGVVSACQTQDGVTPEMIEELESEIRTSDIVDTPSVIKLESFYEEYRENDSGDSLSPLYMIKQADLVQGILEENMRSIKLYEQFIDYYPEHELVPRALFMKAYVYDEKLEDKDNALRAYQYLIHYYPHDPLAEDARNLVGLLNDTISEEERVARWLEEAEKESNTENNK